MTVRVDNWELFDWSIGFVLCTGKKGEEPAVEKPSRRSSNKYVGQEQVAGRLGGRIR